MPPTRTVDRATIVDTAAAILQRDGLEGLSMRRLATELGSKPMTLYHHVPNKSELLSLVLGQIAADIPWESPTGPPRDRLIRVAVDMFEKLSELTWIVPILRAGTNIGTPALALADRFIAAAIELGADEFQAVSLWRSVWYLVSSELMWQSTLASRQTGEQSWFERIDPAELEAMPAVAAALPRWGEYSTAYDLSAAIAAQIDGAVGTFRSAD